MGITYKDMVNNEKILRKNENGKAGGDFEA